ncbi:MAG: c-type cytochrome, partial [Aureliella sp.]
YAARLAIERQEPSQWRDLALRETQPRASISALLALARLGNSEDQSVLLSALERLPLESLGVSELLEALRVWELSFIRQGPPSAADRTRALEQLDALYPHSSNYVNRELCRLLIYLQAPDVIPRSVELIRNAISQEDAIFFSQLVARESDGWTEASREAFFDSLLAARTYKGGHLIGDAILHIREDAIANLTDADKLNLSSRLDQLAAAESDLPALPQAPFVKQWSWDELNAELPQTHQRRSWEQGRAALAKASCVTCHRIGEQGSSTGPDLTHVGHRFDERALLESILLPSKEIDEKYRLSRYLLDNGTVITGRPASVGANVLTIETNSLPTQTVQVKRDEIEQTSQADISPMPSGLVNVLTLDEILDLIAYLKSGGDPGASNYR